MRNKTLDYSKLYRKIQLQAIESSLFRTDEYFYRRVCRWFSKEFSTPILEVYNIPLDFVLMNYYENVLDNMSYNDVYDLAQSDFIPEFMEMIKEQDRKFAESLEQEQIETLARKRKKKQQSLDSKPSKKDEEKVEEEPSNGLDIPKIDLNFDE